MPRITRVKAAQKSKRARHCGRCRDEIQIGQPYLWWRRKTGNASGITYIRCGKPECAPKPSEVVTNQYASMIMAAAEGFDAGVGGFESAQDIAEALREYGQTATEISEMMIENADNMESGFGHSTSTSDELRERGDAWESYAQEVESEADDIEGMEPEDEECSECGQPEDDENHDGGEGDDKHEFDPGDDKMQELITEAIEKAQDIMGNTPE